MKILINYADTKYYNSQKKNSQTGLDIGNFDKVINYNRGSLDPTFRVISHCDTGNSE